MKINTLLFMSILSIIHTNYAMDNTKEEALRKLNETKTNALILHTACCRDIIEIFTQLHQDLSNYNPQNQRSYSPSQDDFDYREKKLEFAVQTVRQTEIVITSLQKILEREILLQNIASTRDHNSDSSIIYRPSDSNS